MPLGPTITGIGIATIAHDTPEALDRNLLMIAEAGADHAEMMVDELRVIAGGRLVTPRLRRIEAVLARHRLGYTVHCPLALNLMDDRHRALHLSVACAGLEFCAAIGARVFVLHPGWMTEADRAANPDRLMGLERAALAELCEVAERYGVRIALENLPPIPDTLIGERVCYGFDPAALARQIAAVDHPNLVATIDFSHAWQAAHYAGTDVLDSLRPLAPLTNHLHVHDSFGRPPTLRRAAPWENMAYGLGDLHLPVGWGTVPWGRLADALAVHPGTVLTLEIDTPYVDAETLADSVARARDIAARMEVAAQTEEAARSESAAGG